MSSSSGSSSLEPETFKARGMTIDTRLQVFGVIFHVQSPILKLYSQYFATYLDSADKVKRTSARSPGAVIEFHYDWVTKVVDGGSDWQLVCAGPKAGDLDVRPCGIDQDKEITAFRNLLNSMYNKPYTLHADEIVALTRIARFYMALPVVSRFLDRVFRESSDFIGAEIRNNACQLLSAAAELRHPALFEDAMIWCLGPFSDPVYKTLEDPKLRKLADQMYGRLNVQIVEMRRDIIDYDARTESDKEQVNNILMEEVQLGKVNKLVCDGKLFIPMLNQDLRDYVRRNGDEDSDLFALIMDNMDDLLISDLNLGHMVEEAGLDIDGCEDYFLSNMLEEGDLPWDPNELDW